MFTNRPVVTRGADGEIPALRLVKVKSGDPLDVTLADAGDSAYGVSIREAADGADIPVAPLHSAVMEEFIAAAAIAKGAEIEPAADGKVQTRTTGQRIGYAANAATEAGKVVTVCIALEAAATHTHDNKTTLDLVPDASEATTGQVMKKAADGGIDWADDATGA